IPVPVSCDQRFGPHHSEGGRHLSLHRLWLIPFTCVVATSFAARMDQSPISGLLAAHGIAGEDVAGTLPAACLKELEGHPRLAVEEGRPPAGNHWKNREVQFVYQILRHQVMPEQAAREHKDVSARLLFEGGDLPVRVRAFDDARILPG